MKKENKKLAQQRRAAQRKKQARNVILGKICKIGIPSLALLVFIGIMVADPFSSSDKKTDTPGSTNTESISNNTQTTTPTLQKDTSLTVKDGDTVNIDYVGSIDGVEFSGGNTQGMGANLTIGSGTYIDDFEEQLIGAHPGDTVDVYATFPENYGKEDLNGKEALFVVTVNGIYK